MTNSLGDLNQLRSPWDWSIEKRYKFAMDTAERLLERRPELAEIWLREVDRLHPLLPPPVPPTGDRPVEANSLISQQEYFC